MQKSFNKQTFILSGLLFLLQIFISAGAHAVNWDTIKGKDIALLYPGQASWEAVLSTPSMGAALKAGKTCRTCHEGDQKNMGDKGVSGKGQLGGKSLEPTPVAGKPGSLPLLVKAAYDAEKLYIKFEWTEPAGEPASKMDPDFVSKVALMLDDGHVVEAARSGCWGTCHDDVKTMPSGTGKEITKYLAASRTKLDRTGGGANYKSQADLDKLLKDGVFMEFWQAKLKKDKPAVPVSGYILDKRHEHTSSPVQAESVFKDGKWSVVLSRKLKLGTAGMKDVEEKKTYAIGFAVHSQYAKERFHHVSFGYTLTLGTGTADIVAIKS
ncbi:MAG: cytochrome c-552 precursor [Gammaproteobacteria bacterium]|nr:cytochrome c-552 precursor [Gammaproteobacteria bacterium]